MAGSLKTAFYNLAKYAANDITSWLTDFNGNMDKIDTAMNQNKTAVKTAQDGVDNLETEYGTVVNTLAQHTTAIDNNEKAIAENSSSIEELENDVNNISIGMYAKYELEDVTKIETLVTGLDFYGRRIGAGFESHGIITFGEGTLHRYDREITTGIFNNSYFTDLFRIAGNPFNLPNNEYLPITAIQSQNDNGNTNYVVDLANASIVYLSESGYTVFGLLSGSATPINFNKYETRIIM